MTEREVISKNVDENVDDAVDVPCGKGDARVVFGEQLDASLFADLTIYCLGMNDEDRAGRSFELTAGIPEGKSVVIQGTGQGGGAGLEATHLVLVVKGSFPLNSDVDMVGSFASSRDPISIP